MTRRRRLVTGCMTLAFGIAIGAAGTVAGAAQPAGWHLVGHHQHTCYDTNVHDGWYGVFIKGTWTHAIDIG
ncbi:MAG: hypothetical protein JO330_08840, partial [Mycobacteriaceae bacterium]|nr:hypothetical protein [Mycobacteriaceae bacterium]